MDDMVLVLARNLSGKAKGKPAPKGAPAPPPPPVASSAVTANPATRSAGARIRRNQPRLDPLTLLTPQQRELAESLAHLSRQAAQPPSATAAGADALTPAAEAAADAAAEAAAAPLRGLGEVPLPLRRREVAALVDAALTGAAGGQQVHFQPFVFNDIFQSAPAAATYVAEALESGSAWGRIERFFLAAAEADAGKLVAAVRVEVAGRIGRKADMAATKSWAWGDLRLASLTSKLDYGTAAANTRMGVLGIKVWIRYQPAAAPDLYFPATGGSGLHAPLPAGAAPSMSLDELYAAALERSGSSSSSSSSSSVGGAGGSSTRYGAVGWWSRPAGQQPAANRVHEVFTPEFNPKAGDRLDGYLRRAAESRRVFRSAANREEYMATVGRFLVKQRQAAKARAAAEAYAAALSATKPATIPTTSSSSSSSSANSSAASSVPARPRLGRRPHRPLARFPVEAFSPLGRRGPVLLRWRLQAAAAVGKGKGGNGERRA
ncbi:hypothetical protein CHLRE_11g467702v5 [Chlamydomonas reinhardtii]|uniref:Small ribosomal subunit protein uS3 C-terminal domain-containing protein n=1 Tax=Chlamydomonas reinhardtii TaxID=3055 RepID=A0A2K3D7R0_CHLRE|nr:uncharacterized protein CHLRE_11g467702v5 [Chlamydomonas reinhardtii]PNW76572.1 hypothetical protein CHLRE_11g467702v5 [Chlamydomonas reinhardtii]7PKQ_c Chain c, Ribosomal_S3_C domain-containing protein [Chlamydomonas reinhardtii]